MSPLTNYKVLLGYSAVCIGGASFLHGFNEYMTAYTKEVENLNDIESQNKDEYQKNIQELRNQQRTALKKLAASTCLVGLGLLGLYSGANDTIYADVSSKEPNIVDDSACPIDKLKNLLSNNISTADAKHFYGWFRGKNISCVNYLPWKESFQKIKNYASLTIPNTEFKENVMWGFKGSHLFYALNATKSGVVFN
jgi:hypothetical protein